MGEFELTFIGKEPNGGDYHFDVLLDGKKITQMRHDYRGDCYEVKLLSGNWVECDRIIEFGSDKPHRLSEKGIMQLNELLTGAPS